MTATPTPAPLLEDDLKQLQDAIAAMPRGWTLDFAGAGNAVGFALVGCVDEDDEFYAVVEVDTGNYGQDDAALPIAQFYAAANPERIARLLAHIAELEKKASDQHELMLTARQQTRAAEDKLSEFRGDIAVALCHDCESGVRWLNEECLVKFKASYPNLYAAIASEAKG